MTNTLRSAVNGRDLEDRNHKRPKVIRTLEKPRKRRKVDSDDEGMEDWIVDDDEDDTVYVRDIVSEESEDEQHSILGSPWKPKLTRLSRRRTEEPVETGTPAPEVIPERITPTHDFSDRLTNSILLCGPNGSGKTAAVYACAEELGWEVFEVYPGIGKRNGASLMSLVGDVGKNHIVSKRSRPAPANFFQKPEENRIDQLLSSSQQKSERDSITSPSRTRYTPDLFSCRGQTPVGGSDPKQATPQQSIILLEEVDILFGDDINFWPTVVTLISESRRPVIMTCNGVSFFQFSSDSISRLQQILDLFRARSYPSNLHSLSTCPHVMLPQLTYNASHSQKGMRLQRKM